MVLCGTFVTIQLVHIHQKENARMLQSKIARACTEALQRAGEAILPDVYFNMEPSLHSTTTEAVSALTDNLRTLSTGKTFLQ